MFSRVVPAVPRMLNGPDTLSMCSSEDHNVVQDAFAE